MLKRKDIEATLRALLMQFQPDAQDTERIARFAEVGAEALLRQERKSTWLDSAASAELLQMTPEELREQVRSGVLPAARSSHGQLRFHKRDLSLYWMSRQFGATASPVPLGAWRDETDMWGFDPWVESTPG